MGIITDTISFMGLGFGTYVHKLDMGNGFKKIRARETDEFLKFKDRGVQYIILKTVPPKIDRRGNKFWYVMETDIHTFDIETGKVLDEEQAIAFKRRLLKNELQSFQELVKGARDEAIKERTQDIYDTLITTDKIMEGETEEQEEEFVKEFTIEVPTIKVGRSLEVKIENLTPHDTINEIMSMILDGTILSALMRKAKVEMATYAGILIVGICLGWILIILFAVLAPEQWSALVGKPVSNPSSYIPPIPQMIGKMIGGLF